jgi:translation initiation factor 2B subunit (eIF-2B alpha/beta/delta family)
MEKHSHVTHRKKPSSDAYVQNNLVSISTKSVSLKETTILISIITIFLLLAFSGKIISGLQTTINDSSSEKPAAIPSLKPTPTPTTSPYKTFKSAGSLYSIQLPPCLVTKTRSLQGYLEVIEISSRSNLNIPLATIYVSEGNNPTAVQMKFTSNYQIIGKAEKSEVNHKNFNGIVEKLITNDQQLPKRSIASVSNGKIILTINGDSALVTHILNQLTIY